MAKLAEQRCDAGGDCEQLSPLLPATKPAGNRCESLWRERRLLVIDEIQHRPNLGALDVNIVIVQFFYPTKYRSANTCHGISTFVMLREDCVVSSLEVMEVRVHIDETLI